MVKVKVVTAKSIKAKKRIKAFTGELSCGVYVSTEKPECLDVSDPRVQAAKARFEVPGSGKAFCWNRETPRMLVRTKHMPDLMKYLPAIFGKHEGAKIEPKLSCERGFVYSAGNSWLIIPTPSYQFY